MSAPTLERLALDIQAIEALTGAYVALLRLPVEQRLSVQRELCACRDAISALSGVTAEVVQTGHETLAVLTGTLR
jgi:hypothetical protein